MSILIDKIDTNSKCYNSIDVMKFICAILVVAIHTSPFESYSRILNQGLGILTRLPVPFFFTTSSYLFFSKIEIDNIGNKYNNNKLKNYLKRIVKLYILWSIIYFPFNLYEMIKNDNIISTNMIIYIRNFIFVGSFDTLWYLPALVMSITITYFLLKYVSLGKVIGVSIILYIIGLLGSTYYGVISDVEVIVNIFKYYNKFFITTRNGLFYGTIFVSIGAYIAKYKSNLSINPKLCLIGLITSIILLAIESFIVIKLNINRETIMWIGMIPSTVFLVLLCINLKIKNSRYFKACRKLSTLIYTSHGLFIIIMPFFLGEFYDNSLIRFISVLTSSIIFSYFVIYISKIKVFNKVRCLY